LREEKGKEKMSEAVLLTAAQRIGEHGNGSGIFPSSFFSPWLCEEAGNK
jgi:hypothetical protein